MDEHEDDHPNVVTPELLAETEALLRLENDQRNTCPEQPFSFEFDSVPGWGVYR